MVTVLVICGLDDVNFSSSGWIDARARVSGPEGGLKAAGAKFSIRSSILLPSWNHGEIRNDQDLGIIVFALKSETGSP